jgi:DNA-binding protein HU-beta
MNKTELIDEIASQANLSKAAASESLKAVLDAIQAGLINDGTVSILGFGTFMAKTRAARTGRNPLTGAEINIGATKVVTFKAGKALKDAVKDAAQTESVA